MSASVRRARHSGLDAMRDDDVGVIRIGGVCALLGACAGIIGSVVGAAYGLGGQQIPVGGGVDLLRLTQLQAHYVTREWLFLAYAVFATGEGVGLYYLTRRSSNFALWALVAWFTGAVVGIVQDAIVVAFVHRFPADYAAADAPTRVLLEPLARNVLAVVDVQQSVANLLLGIGVALYSVASLRTRTAPIGFALFGITAAAAGVLYALVITSGQQLAGLQPLAEQVFGLVVVWDVWAGIVMLRARRRDGVRGDDPALGRAPNHRLQRTAMDKGSQHVRSSAAAEPGR